MAYIWHFNIDGQIELHEDAIKLIPAFAFLEQKQIRYIILYADYRYSPILGFPDHQRDKIARLKAGYLETDEVLSTKDIQDGIFEYKSLIYDDRRETKQDLQNKLEDQRKKLKESTTLKEMKECMEMIKFLEVEISKIDLKLTAEEFDDDVDIKGDKKLSYVEKWMRRRKKYLSMIPADAH